MAAQERQRDRGARRGRLVLADLGRELREARRAHGLSQEAVGRAAGVSHAWISRIELGRATDVHLVELSTILAVVGLDLAARAYPGASPLRDAGHHRLMTRVRALLPPDAPWRTEVPFPRTDDQRAWDAWTRLWNVTYGVEAEMRPTDLQALERRLRLKLRDGGVDRLLLALADTRANRSFVAGMGEALRDIVPIRQSAARAALRSGVDPGAGLLLVV
jgi:transcriptional regulator with XRE-family HTH domain